MHDRTQTRREFLANSGLAFACVPHLPIGKIAAWSDGKSGSSGWSHDDWVNRVREEIPSLSKSIYLQTGGVGPSPGAVIEEVKSLLDFQNQGPADPRFSGPMGRIEPELRAHLGRSFVADTEEVALTHSTSEGINIVVWSLNWSSGDEVIISNQEHPSNVIPWYVMRDRFGVVIRTINFDVGTSLLDEVRQKLSSRTRMVSISHVSRNNGRRVRTDESAELAELLRRRGVRYHLDGAQGPGCVGVNFHALGCDCYSTCGHKWLLGPKGTGAIFVRRDELDRVLLSWTGAHSHETMDYEGAYRLLPAAARYEFGTRALADFAGFDRAVSWFDEVGWKNVYERVDALVEHAIRRTKSASGFSIASPEDSQDRSGVFVVRLPKGYDSQMVYERLRSDERILASPVRRERDLRLSIHFFNTRDEIDTAIDVLTEICQ